MKYITTIELAELWQMTERGARKLCPRIEGAERVEGAWRIPSTAIRPDDKRFKTGNYQRRAKINPRINTGLVNNVIFGDCMVKMREIKSKSIDFIQCDLPYTDSGDWVLCMKDSDGRRYALKELWKEYLRILKPNGVIALMGAELFTYRLALSNPKMFKYKIVWGKTSPSGVIQNQPLRYHEDICIFYNTKSVNRQGEVTYNHQKTNVILRKNKNRAINELEKPEWYEGESGWPTDVVFYDREIDDDNKNRSRKPVALCEYLIKTYSNEGDTVLDNSSGGGSTLVAAIKSLRNFIGIDLNDKFFMRNKSKADVNETVDVEETVDFVTDSKIRICAEWTILSEDKRALLQKSTMFKDFKSGSFKNSLTDGQKERLERLVAKRKTEEECEKLRPVYMKHMKKNLEELHGSLIELSRQRNEAKHKEIKDKIKARMDDVKILMRYNKQLYRNLQPHNPPIDISPTTEKIKELLGISGNEP